MNWEWLAIGLSLHGGTKDEKNYYSYNPEYAGVEEFAHVQSGGQSPIEKYLALTNMEVGVKAVEYFIRTGNFIQALTGQNSSKRISRGEDDEKTNG